MSVCSNGFIIVDEDGNYLTGFFSIETPDGDKKIILNYIPKEDFDIMFNDILNHCILYNKKEAERKQKYLQEKSLLYWNAKKTFHVKKIEL